MMKKNGKEKQPPQVRSQIVITLFDDGNFQCSGPMHDRILFYGLLEMARDAIILQAGQKAQQQQKAEAVKGSLPWWRRVFGGRGPDRSANPGEALHRLDEELRREGVVKAANELQPLGKILTDLEVEARAVGESAESLKSRLGGEALRREGHSALRPDGKGGLEKFDPHPIEHPPIPPKHDPRG